jgi:hypothetical protein
MNRKFQVVHIKLTESDEAEAKRLAKKIFPYLIMMSSDLETFLDSHGLLSRKNRIVKDSQGFLYAIKMRQTLPNFLNTNGKTKTAVKRNISEAIKGRNAICHSNLPEVLNHWRVYLNSWVEVCLMIGSSQTASEIRRGLGALSQPITNLTVGLNPTVTAMTIFTNLEIQSNVKTWTAEKEEASVFLGQIFYDLFTDIYSPALTDFAIARRHQCPTSVIDCHELTELIKINCTAADFHSPHDAACFDVSNLKVAADGRHAAIHEQKTNLLANWDRYLHSMMYVTKGIGAMTAAKTIGRARGHLVRARDRARRLVNPIQQSANPSGGQPIATASNSTQTSRQKSTRRNKIPAVAGGSRRRR